MLALLMSATLLVSHPVFVEGEEKKRIEVVKHVVEGESGWEDIETWIEDANVVYGCSLVFVLVGSYNHSSYDNGKNNASKINIWAVPKKSWGVPHASGQSDKEIQLTLGKWPDVTIKDCTLSHELGHVFGLPHSSDPNNVMHPDIQGTKSCHRKGDNCTDGQQGDVRSAVSSFVAKEEGRGQDVYDPVEANIDDFMDIQWAEGWAEYALTKWTLHLSLNTFSLPLADCWLGFLVESDSDVSTGDPIEGIDYALTFNPAYNIVEFSRYDEEWTPLEPTGIIHEFSYACGDTDAFPIICGISFSLPLTLLDRRAGNRVSVRAITDNVTHSDQAPEGDFLIINSLTEPSPPPGIPEFTMVLTLEILLIPVVIYALWRKQRKKVLT